tara:strand:- start:1148 stop:1354 length:207 start_codon:yes stop_codon:yes gene_type:complete
MYIAIGIIFGFLFTGLLIIHYLDYREEQRNQKKFKENFEKFSTRTGALSNDRINERTTIPKRNGKRNT